MVLALLGSSALCEASSAFVDMTGRPLKLSEPLTRVVALEPADCEILFALGAGDALVGRGAFCNYPEAIHAVPAVNAGYELNIEQVLALAPQAIIMTKMGQTVDQVQAFETFGIPVIVTDAQDIAGTYEAIRLLGRLMGKQSEADALIAGMTAELDAVQAAARAQNGKTIYFEVSPLEYGLWTTGTGTFMNELAALCGLTNIFADVQGWAAISVEQVLVRNPDIIVTLTPAFEGTQLPEDEIRSRVGWGGMTAVKTGAVYRGDSDIISRPGPRLADAARALYDMAYGAQPCQ